jgi:hypothetical protein
MEESQIQERKTYSYGELKNMSFAELQKIGKELELRRVTGLRKEELIEDILQAQAQLEGLNFIKGVLGDSAGRLWLYQKTREQLYAKPWGCLCGTLPDQKVWAEDRRPDRGLCKTTPR